MRVALVHDYLTQHGGAERVLEALHELFPDAPVFTSLFAPRALPADYGGWDIRESPLRRLPGAARYHRGLLPFYPALFRSFRGALRPFDLILSDSSAWAHHAPAPKGAVHVCYCHSPARFLYGDEGYLAPAKIPGAARAALPAVLTALRAADRRAAGRVDQYLANSRAVAARIRAAYGREARVIYPPVDVERFAGDGPVPVPAEWYLVVSRLVPHKRVDLAVDACTKAELPLRVVGDGRSLADLRRRAGPTVEFLGRVEDDEAAALLRRCRAFILPAAEDFGMTAVEAQAAGRPVIAFAGGGALESVIPGETGVFFAEQSPEALLGAIAECETRRWVPERLRANAQRFSKGRFLAEIRIEIEQAIARRAARLPGVGEEPRGR